MENLDYFNLIVNSEAASTSDAFGISEERIAEIEHLFVKGYNEFGKAIVAGNNLTKTDLFLFVSRAGFTAQTPQELIYMTLMVAERITKNELMGGMAEFMPVDLVKKLFSVLGGEQRCECEDCKTKRLIEGDDDDNDGDDL